MIDIFYGDGHVVETPQGYRTIHIDGDLIDCIREGCGNEVADLIEEIINELDDGSTYERERAKTDADAFEASCDSYHAMLNDAMSSIEDLQKQIMEKPKLHRSTIFRALENIRDDINGQL